MSVGVCVWGHVWGVWWEIKKKGGVGDAVWVLQQINGSSELREILFK